VVEGDVIANDGGFTDNNTSTVVNKKTCPDRGSRMNINVADQPGKKRQPTGTIAPASQPQPVRNTVKNQGVNTGIGGQHFKSGTGCRVTLKNAGDIFTPL
jgi:hypothetical protein